MLARPPAVVMANRRTRRARPIGAGPVTVRSREGRPRRRDHRLRSAKIMGALRGQLMFRMMRGELCTDAVRTRSPAPGAMDMPVEPRSAGWMPGCGTGTSAAADAAERRSTRTLQNRLSGKACEPLEYVSCPTGLSRTPLRDRRAQDGSGNTAEGSHRWLVPAAQTRVTPGHLGSRPHAIALSMRARKVLTRTVKSTAHTQTTAHHGAHRRGRVPRRQPLLHPAGLPRPDPTGGVNTGGRPHPYRNHWLGRSVPHTRCPVCRVRHTRTAPCDVLGARGSRRTRRYPAP
ncbi:hypothetical protein GKJPGBOP_01588 [Streptomyces paromomycinus]|uniref:Uncharacterized protein n=1 Tax=Streptomyces paromomycinus TaxID=92743 RepID=A0A401VXX7_STREY|nr:hypothetical protein GKJPGBOP_01588 [Streptomyces paromomycinus]